MDAAALQLCWFPTAPAKTFLGQPRCKVPKVGVSVFACGCALQHPVAGGFGDKAWATASWIEVVIQKVMEAGVGNGAAASAVRVEGDCQVEAASGEGAVSGGDSARIGAFGHGDCSFMGMRGQHGDLAGSALRIAHHRV